MKYYVSKSIKGFNELIIIDRYIKVLDHLGAVFNPKKHKWARLSMTNKRGSQALLELQHAMMDIVGATYPKLPSNDLYLERNWYDHTLSNLYPVICAPDHINLGDITNLTVLYDPTQAQISEAIIKYEDDISGQVEDIDVVYLIKSKIAQYHLTNEEKLKLIRILSFSP